MQTRKRDGQVEAMEHKFLLMQHFTYPTQPRCFYPIRTQVRTRPLHLPNPQPKSKSLPAKAKPPPRVKKGVIAHPDKDEGNKGREEAEGTAIEREDKFDGGWCG